MAKKGILITGGTGLVGDYATGMLLERGDRPVIFAKPERVDGQNFIAHEFAAAATDSRIAQGHRAEKQIRQQIVDAELLGLALDLGQHGRGRPGDHRSIRQHEPPRQRCFDPGFRRTDSHACLE